MSRLPPADVLLRTVEARDQFFVSLVFVRRDTAGTFPEYPPEENGGSAPLFVNKDPQQVARRAA